MEIGLVRVRLRRGVDRNKDQSYQLFPVAEASLARTVLPLGTLEKPAVRELAAAVDDFVNRACAKNPKHRHQTALEMQTELNSMLGILNQISGGEGDLG